MVHQINKEHFKVLKNYPDGTKFIQARDEKYKGFTTMLSPHDDINKMYDEFEFFKKVVNKEVFLEVKE